VTLLEAKTALANTKLNTSLADITAGTNQLWTVQDLLDGLNFGVLKAWDYKPWTFTEGSVTLTAPNPTVASYTYPTNFVDESIFMIIVNAVAWTGPGNGKRNFFDYQKWFSDYPKDTSLIWTEYARQYYLNQNAYAAGQSYTLFGKLRATILASDGDLLPFSPSSDNYEDSGNEAIIHFAYGYLLGSEKKKDKVGAAAEEKAAYAILDYVWKPMGERRAKSQSQNRPFFNTQDMFNTRRSMRGDTNIGNFP
jgi:hypothetical protein